MLLNFYVLRLIIKDLAFCELTNSPLSWISRWISPLSRLGLKMLFKKYHTVSLSRTVPLISLPFPPSHGFFCCYVPFQDSFCSVRLKISFTANDKTKCKWSRSMVLHSTIFHLSLTLSFFRLDFFLLRCLYRSRHRIWPYSPHNAIIPSSLCRSRHPLHQSHYSHFNLFSNFPVFFFLMWWLRPDHLVFALCYIAIDPLVLEWHTNPEFPL